MTALCSTIEVTILYQGTVVTVGVVLQQLTLLQMLSRYTDKGIAYMVVLLLMQLLHVQHSSCMCVA